MPKIGDTIGCLVEVGLGSFLWQIPDFSGLPKQEWFSFCSPYFHLGKTTWRMWMYPNGTKEFPGRIHLHVFRSDCGPAKTFHWIVGVRRADGEEKAVGTQTIKIGYCEDVLYKFHKGAEEFDWLDSGTLTLTLRITEEGDTTSQGPSCVASESRKRKAEVLDVENEEESDECTDPKAKGVGKLQLDYKKLLESGSESDLLVVVSGQEFRAHKCIMRARSPVFDAMFEHETEEKESGKLVIDDLDPDTFRTFLEYLYTGSARELSGENVFGLYTAAVKYNVQQLKAEAVQCLMQSALTVESFCDFIALAFLHGEDELVRHAVGFFKNNLSRILATEKWRALLRENGAVVNELFMKMSTL